MVLSKVPKPLLSHLSWDKHTNPSLSKDRGGGGEGVEWGMGGRDGSVGDVYIVQALGPDSNLKTQVST